MSTESQKQNSTEVHTNPVQFHSPQQTYSRPNAIPQIGHPLNSSWHFWYVQRFQMQQNYHNKGDYNGQNQAEINGDQQKQGQTNIYDNYKDRLKDMGQISTVEQFFQYFVYMKKPSEMPREIDLFFFRDNEIPMWEGSPNGGIWITKIKKEDNINKMWESLLLALIGEQFEEPQVIGMALSLRTKERLLQVWLKDGKNEKVRTNVSNKLRQILSLDPDNVTLYYKEHQKSIKDQSTMKNAEGFKFMKGDSRNKNKFQPAYGSQQKSWTNNQFGSNSGHQQDGGNGHSQQQYYKKKYGDKPFSHLGANYPEQHGDSNYQQQKVYRAKAQSHHQQ